MKKWQDLDIDGNSYYDVDHVWPTNRQSYETSDFATSSDLTGTAAGSVTYAWAGGIINTNAINPEYVVTSTKIWQYDPASIGTPMTDRTGGMTVGVRPQMAAVGTATIAVMGSPLGALPGRDTLYASSSAANFAVLTGAPQGHSVVVAFNAVWIFNTDTGSSDFEMSDVGDYTNWSTGEWFAGTVYDGAGPINAAVEFGGAVYSSKMDNLVRHRYVGGVQKVITETVWSGVGCGQRNAMCAGSTGILFAGYHKADPGSPPVPFYWFDGVNPPVLTNPLTTIGDGSSSWTIVYDSHRDMFTAWDRTALRAYYFSPKDMAWGRASAPYGATPGNVKIVDGQGIYGRRTPSPTTPAWVTPSTDVLRRFSPTTTGAGTCYVETAKFGTQSSKLNFNRCTPRLRRLVDVGTQSESVTASCFRELHDTSASSTPTYTKASGRHRWDGQAADNFIRFKYSATDYDVEIEDLTPEAIPAGKN
jgi:hypothetical protein